MTLPNKPCATRPTLSDYSNYFEVGQNPYEFVLNFGQFAADADCVYFHTRIATTPVFAKLLLAALQEAICTHEEQYGAIATVLEPDSAQNPASHRR